MKPPSPTLRIGGASGFWGDATLATQQLLVAGGLDFIVYDYLAEITMGILARVRVKDQTQGFAPDFVTQAMAPNLAEIDRQGVRIVSNAGGMNPLGCAEALRAEIERQGLALKVAAVTGDDLLPQAAALKAAGSTDMFTGAPFPDPVAVASVNAYLGAFPIATALAGGADIVITGRCVDSAVTLGACIHHFGWTPQDLAQLAGGSLAGHIIECGTQATGGNFTDWESVADGYATMGYPVAEVAADGSFTVSKPAGSGGQVSVGTVGEQMLYEIGDPGAYLLPDVVCDFTEVRLEQVGNDLVRVSGALGRPAPSSYKTCVTWGNGFRGGHLFGFYGLDAERKAAVFAEAAFERTRKAFAQKGLPDFLETSVELVGTESQFGDQRTSGPAREVTAKVAVKHASPKGVDLFLKEATGLGLASPPGLCGFAGARPKASPVMALFSTLVSKSQIQIAIHDDAGPHAFTDAKGVETPVPQLVVPPAPEPAVDLVPVPLIELAWARSGDKGNNANVGVMARRPDYLPWIWHALDEATVAACFSHFQVQRVERFWLPGSHAINFLLHAVLGGGGANSLRFDPQGKGYSQLMLGLPIRVPRLLLDSR